MAWIRWRRGDAASPPAQQGAGEVSPLTPPQSLLLTHEARLDVLRLESGYGAAQFATLFEEVIRDVAEYVHVLPATRAENHSERGGLLRLAIESAAFAFRRADGQFLAGNVHTDVGNRERERVWRYALFLAGLLQPIGRSATAVAVSSEGGEQHWNAYECGLWAWARRVGARELNIEWRDGTDGKPELASAVWIAGRVLPQAAFAYMGTGGSAVLEVFVAMLGGIRSGRSGDILEEARQAVINQDLLQMGGARRSESGGISIEAYLVDALRSLIREKWTVNTAGGRLWVAREGVFLMWRAAIADIAIKLRAAGVTQAPRDPDTLAELLVERGVLSTNPDAVGSIKHYYRIVPRTKGVPRQPLEVVRLADPKALALDADAIEPIDVEFPVSAPNILQSSRVAAQPAPRSAEVRRPAPIATLKPTAGGSRGSGSARAAQRAANLQLPLSEPDSASAMSSERGADALPPALLEVAERQGEPSSGSGSAVAPSVASSLVPEPSAAPPTTAEVPPPQPGSSTPTVSAESVSRPPVQLHLERLGQFGAAGRTLRRFGERLLQQPPLSGVVRISEGVALAYPQTLLGLGEDPQSFLHACESQGLLVRDPTLPGRLVWESSNPPAGLPERYIVLSPRVSRYLPQDRMSAHGDRQN